MMRRLGTASLAFVLALILPACFAPLKQVSGRTAIDQQLTSAAISRAVDKLDLDLESLGDRYRIVVTAPNQVDTQWVKACLERRLQREGVPKGQKDSQELPTLEAVVAYAGSDVEGVLWGIPLVYPPIVTPFGHISLWKSDTQLGRARIGLFLWDGKGNLIREVPETEGKAYINNQTYLTLFGPFMFTDLEDLK